MHFTYKYFRDEAVSGFVSVVFVYVSLKMAVKLLNCTVEEQHPVIRFFCGQNALKRVESITECVGQTGE